MKLTKSVNLLVIGLALGIAAVGCKHKPVGVTAIPGAPTGAPGDAGQGGAIGNGNMANDQTQSSAIPANAPNSHAGWKEDAQALQANSIHFDYDSSVIRSGDKPNIEAVADYLKGNPSAAVRVEGNCDERGTEEYNRSLGERRALAAREELVGLGVDASRVDTISYGKDRPVDTGHSEASHAKNRRDDFVVLTPN